MSAIDMQQLAEPYIRRRAVRHLEKGRVVIFAAGTGNPYFTTDTAGGAAGDGDPRRHAAQGDQGRRHLRQGPGKAPRRQRYEKVTYLECLQKDLKVMDMTAFALCRDNKLPIMVFNLHERGNIKRALGGERVGTIVVAE
jgi:uridylate kinase